MVVSVFLVYSEEGFRSFALIAAKRGLFIIFFVPVTEKPYSWFSCTVLLFPLCFPLGNQNELSIQYTEAHRLHHRDFDGNGKE